MATTITATDIAAAYRKAHGQKSESVNESLVTAMLDGAETITREQAIQIVQHLHRQIEGGRLLKVKGQSERANIETIAAAADRVTAMLAEQA